MALTKVKAGNILLTTPGASSNDVTPATTAYVTTALANLADSAPSTLDTLNELAAALGDDANFSTTVTNSIAAKLPLAGGTMTGHLDIGGNLKLSDGYLEFDKPSVKGFRFLQNDIGNDLSIQQGDTNNANYVTKLNISSAGNVGIGTSSPLSKLHVYSATAASTPKDQYAVALFDDSEGRIQVRATNNGSDGAVVGLSTGSHNWGLMATAAGTFSNAFAIGYANTSTDGNVFGVDSMSEKLVITTSGNVGIGETAPLAKLHIKRGDSGLSSLNAAGDHIFLENTGANGTGITLASGNTANGSIIFGDQDSNYRGVLIYDHSVDAMKFVTAGTERMRIQSNGGISLTGNHQFNFRATGLSNSGLGAVMVFDTVASGNAAGCYSTSSGMYQAAIDGWYMVSVGIRYDSITGSSGYARPQLRFLANNSSTWLYPHNGFWVDPIIGTSTTNGSYMNCTYSVPMYLANGDNIQLIEQGASVTITHNHDESHFGVIFMG